jgi:N-acetylglucosamine repressor
MQLTLTTTDVRQSNKIKILKFVREHEETTKPEISKALGISRPTVSTVVDDLIKDGYMQIRGIGNSTEHGGKRPQLIAFRAGGRGIISIHVGVEMIDGAFLDLNASIQFRIKVKTKPQEGKERILTDIFETITLLFKKADEFNVPVLGIGVGCPGLINTNSGTIIKSVNFKELNNIKLGELISKKFNKRVLVDNEDHNLALAEKWFGIGSHTNTFVSLMTDVGIGAGIIIENEIHRGIDNSFGEIGHTMINMEGPLCHCGNNGCWETYASSNALLKKIKEQIDHTEVLRGLVKTSEELSLSHIVEALQKGDKIVEKTAIHELGKYLGLGIVNTVNTFNPEMVIIHGSITELGEKLIIEIDKWVKEKALPTAGSRVKIKFSKLGYNAHIIGAGALVIKEMFDQPEYLFNT